MFIDIVKVEAAPTTPNWVLRVVEASGYRCRMIGCGWIICA